MQLVTRSKGYAVCNIVRNAQLVALKDVLVVTKGHPAYEMVKGLQFVT